MATRGLPSGPRGRFLCRVPGGHLQPAWTPSIGETFLDLSYFSFFFCSNGNGLQPTNSNGLQPNSDGLQPNRKDMLGEQTINSNRKHRIRRDRRQASTAFCILKSLRPNERDPQNLTAMCVPELATSTSLLNPNICSDLLCSYPRFRMCVPCKNKPSQGYYTTTGWLNETCPYACPSGFPPMEVNPNCSQLRASSSRGSRDVLSLVRR